MYVPIRILAGLLLILAPAALYAEQPAPLSEAEVPLDQLNTESETTLHLRFYMSSATGSGEDRRISLRPRDAGQYRLRTERTPDAVILHDHLAMTIMGDMTLIRTTVCEPSAALPPTEIAVTMERRGRKHDATLTVADGQASMKLPDGTTRSMPYPQDAVSMNALLRIFELLPREQGRAWTVGAIAEIVEMGFVRPVGQDAIVITCRGEEQLTVGDRQFDCVRFDVTTGNERKNMSAWVDGAGLQQVMMGADMRMTRHPMEPITADDRDAMFDEIFERITR